MYGGIIGNIHQQHACDHDQLDQGCCHTARYFSEIMPFMSPTVNLINISISISDSIEITQDAITLTQECIFITLLSSKLLF